MRVQIVIRLERERNVELRRHADEGIIARQDPDNDVGLSVQHDGLAEHLGIGGRREASGDSERSAPPPSTAGIAPSQPPRVESLAELEKRAIADALAAANGNKSRAAAALGLTRFQLYARLKRFGLTE